MKTDNWLVVLWPAVKQVATGKLMVTLGPWVKSVATKEGGK